MTDMERSKTFRQVIYIGPFSRISESCPGFSFVPLGRIGGTAKPGNGLTSFFPVI